MIWGLIKNSHLQDFCFCGGTVFSIHHTHTPFLYLLHNVQLRMTEFITLNQKSCRQQDNSNNDYPKKKLLYFSMPVSVSFAFLLNTSDPEYLHHKTWGI